MIESKVLKNIAPYTKSNTHNTEDCFVYDPNYKSNKKDGSAFLFKEELDYCKDINIRANINNRIETILVDTGSTYSYIDKEYAMQNKFKVVEDKPLKAISINNQKILTNK